MTMTLTTTKPTAVAGRPRALVGSVALALPLLLGSCQSLDVVNQNSVAIEGVFSDAANIESALVGGFRDFWGVVQGAGASSPSPAREWGVLGNAMTTADAGPMELTAEPRGAIDNRNAGGWYNRKPWYDLYQVISTGRDVIQSIEKNNLKLGVVDADNPNGADTKRAIVFSRMLIGLGNLYIGLAFDQGFPADATDDPETFEYVLQPYDAVLAKGREKLRQAIAEAKAAPDFTLPPQWINGQEYTRDELVRIMYSYLARSYAYAPRTPEQRAAVDWQHVLALVDSGITRDFVQLADATVSATTGQYINYSLLQTNARTSLRLLGPADTTGAYQAWLAAPLDQRAAFVINTPDKRISNATANLQPAPVRFRRVASQTMTSNRGTYMHSNYNSIRYRNALNNYATTDIIPTMTMDEMKFLRAEALYRLNRRSEVPALLNPSRAIAGLPPVTEAGVPASPSCVPRSDNGGCGNLFEALMYEKRMEMYPTEAFVDYADQRGWGRLLTGTPLHYPVHGRELETLGLPYYTIGGSGPGSAP